MILISFLCKNCNILIIYLFKKKNNNKKIISLKKLTNSLNLNLII